MGTEAAAGLSIEEVMPELVELECDRREASSGGGGAGDVPTWFDVTLVPPLTLPPGFKMAWRTRGYVCRVSGGPPVTLSTRLPGGMRFGNEPPITFGATDAIELPSSKAPELPRRDVVKRDVHCGAATSP